LVYGGALAGLGLTDIATITVVDDGTEVGGAPGIFSGFDVDAIFLDVDGNPYTAADRYYADSYLFTAGSTRDPGGNTAWEANTDHPGPTFGSLDAGTIDMATATLETLDGVSVADVDVADGFLTLGDGGTLILSFDPAVPVSATLMLLVGEVGGQVGEELGAYVMVSDTPITPAPDAGMTVVLLGLGVIGLAGFGRRSRT